MPSTFRKRLPKWLLKTKFQKHTIYYAKCVSFSSKQQSKNDARSGEQLDIKTMATDVHFSACKDLQVT